MKSYDKAPSGAVERARKLRRNSTDAEKLLWRKLREQLAAAKFRRQSPVGPYITDLLSHRHKLIIEVDGGQHAEHVGLTPSARNSSRAKATKSSAFGTTAF